MPEMPRRILRYSLCAVAGFCFGIFLSGYLLLPDTNCQTTTLKTPHIVNLLPRGDGVAEVAPAKADRAPPPFTVPERARRKLPADSAPAVARPRPNNGGGEDGPMHKPDTANMQRDFSKVNMQVKVQDRESRTGDRPLTVTQELGLHKTLYVGVVTAKKYFRTRATAINNTWGRLVPKVNFFAPGADSEEGRHLPIISMKGVDDSYPPQKKVFSMLKYMHDNVLEQYNWFLRADDDLFLRPEELMEFLQTLDPAKPIYMGQPGIGFKRDRERLKLQDGEVYCMGGTGVFYSRSALKRVRPFLDECFAEVMSYHEDVEVGRCLSRKAGLQCTWNYELGKLLYYDITEKQFRGEDIPKDAKTIKTLTTALTIHPVKDPPMFYKLHKFYTELRMATVRRSLESLRQQRRALIAYLPLGTLPEFHQYWPSDIPPPFRPQSRFEIIPWEYFTEKTLYQNVEQLPSLGLGGSNRLDVQTAMKTAEVIFSQLYGGQKLKKFSLANGYRRLDPTRGMEYVMDVNGVLGNGTMVQRERLNFLRPFGDVQSIDEVSSDAFAVVNIIVPISGVAERFRQFLNNYEKTCLAVHPPQATRLIAVVFSESDADYRNTAKVVEDLKTKYRHANVRILRAPGKFSRAKGLDVGAQSLGQNELMFFVDADLDFDDTFLRRCRKNTAVGQQAYFPVVFMLFNPDVVYASKPPPKQVSVSRDTGHWASYAFGMVCTYRKDYDSVGGFDLSIKGWGAEDVKLFDKFVASKSIRTFRAVDPGLIHRFHMKKCDPKLSGDQFRMCIGALAEGYASKSQLAQLYLSSQNRGKL